MGTGRVLAVVGATAAGKSDLAVALALRFEADGAPAEIVNADSMQLYRGMDIGTAKAPLADRGGVVHHLIDVLDPRQPASVAVVRDLARAVIDDCHRRGVIPIVVGGSALYVHAILDKMEFPPTDPQVRARLQEDAHLLGARVMHARLAELDPVAAATILPGNLRRIVRALEVVEITGGPYTATLPEPVYVYDEVLQVGIDVDRDVLAERIEGRVRRMWTAGLVGEVRRLAAAGLADAPTASRALGYAQVLAFLDGTVTEDEARVATVVGTRRFARRQLSWFRRDGRIRWLPGDAPDLVELAWALASASGEGVGAYRDRQPWEVITGSDEEG
jgi:tRNA dimethylallyltransferase